MRTKEGNKREDIIRAAISEFAKKGFHKAKVATIAENAAVATGSVYVYFENKESLIYEIFDDVWKKLYESMEVLAGQEDVSPVEKFDAMIDMIFDTFTESPDLALVIVNEQNPLLVSNTGKFTKYYDMFITLGEKIIKNGIQKGIFTDKIDIPIFRHYFLGAFRDLVHSWALDKKAFPLNLIRQNIKFLSKNGLLNRSK